MSQSSPITPLASAQVNHDHPKVELIEPDGMPPAVRITWPAAPSIVNPRQFPDVAAQVAQLFARAHIVLAALKAGEATVNGAEALAAARRTYAAQAARQAEVDALAAALAAHLKWLRENPDAVWKTLTRE